MRRILMAVVVLAVAGCGSDDGGGGDSPDVATAARERIEQLSAGQFAAAYEAIHPAQQELVDQETYVRCATAALSGVDYGVDEVGDIREIDGRTVPGTDQQATVTEVTVTISSGEVADTQTHPFVLVGGEWRALIEPTMFEDC